MFGTGLNINRNITVWCINTNVSSTDSINNRNSFFNTISAFQSNKFTAEALLLAEQGVKHFPYSYSAWKLLFNLAPEESALREEALSKLHELDPNNPEYIKN